MATPRFQCGMRNVECGMAVRASSLALQFRIPNSAFRISLSRLPPLPTPDNEFRRRLLLMPRLATLHLAPRGRRGPPARGLPLAATQRVIHRVHRHAAHPGPAPEPAGLPRLADREQLVLGV